MWILPFHNLIRLPCFADDFHWHTTMSSKCTPYFVKLSNTSCFAILFATHTSSPSVYFCFLSLPAARTLLFALLSLKQHSSFSISSCCLSSSFSLSFLSLRFVFTDFLSLYPPYALPLEKRWPDPRPIVSVHIILCIRTWCVLYTPTKSIFHSGGILHRILYTQRNVDSSLPQEKDKTKKNRMQKGEGKSEDVGWGINGWGSGFVKNKRLWVGVGKMTKPCREEGTQLCHLLQVGIQRRSKKIYSKDMDNKDDGKQRDGEMNWREKRAQRTTREKLPVQVR